MASNATIGILRALLTADTSQFDAAMASSAKAINSWSANFSKFGLSAQQVGSVALNELTRSSNAIDKFAKQFSGAGIAKQADEMAAAITRIGGASTLTESEMRKVNSVVTEAIAKYEALGLSAPKHLTDLANATKTVESGWDKAESALNVFGLSLQSLSLAAAGAALMSMGKAAVEFAGHLQDLSARTGISVQDLQKFNAAGEQVGVGLDTIATGANRLQKSLVEGNPAAVAALDKLGLSAQQLMAVSPGTMLEEISRALGKIPDPAQRSAIAMELLGRNGAELLPLLTADLDKLTDGVITMSDRTIENLDRVGDAWQRFKISIESELANAATFAADHPIKFLVQFVKQGAGAPTTGDEIKAQLDSDVSAQLPNLVKTAQAGIQPFMDTFRDAGVTIKKATDAEREFFAAGGDDAAKKAIAAAKAYADAVKALVQEWTGEKALETAQLWSEALKEAGGSAELTTDDLKKITEQVQKWIEAGIDVPENLRAIWRENQTWDGILRASNTDILKLTGTVTQSTKSLLAYGDAQLDADQKFQSLIVPASKFSQILKDLPGTPVKISLPPPSDLDKLTADLHGLAHGLDLLANSGDNAFSHIVRDIQLGVASALQFTQALRGVQAQGASTAEQLAGYATMVGAVVQGTIALGNAIDRADTQRTRNRLSADIQKQFGVTPDSNLLDQIQNSTSPADFQALQNASGHSIFSSNFAQLQAQFQALVNLPSIMKAAGALTAESTRNFEQQAMQLFDFIKLGGSTGQKAMDALSASIEMFAAQAEKTGGLWDASFQQIIAKAKEAGLSIDGINQAIQGQQSKLGGALTNVVGGFTGEHADTIKKIQDLQSGDQSGDVTQQIADLRAGAAGAADEFDRLSRIALNSFNTLVASGMTADQAIATIGPSIDGLISDASALGLQGNSAFQELSRWRTLTQQFAPLISEAGSLNDVLTATANLGGLTADAFADMQAQGEAAYQQLIAAGFTQQEAEKQIAPLIQTEIQLHKDKGLAIDEGTQALYDQMVADGTLSAQQESTNDILIDGFTAIITAVGGDIPDAFKKMAKSGQSAASDIQDALDKIQAPDLTGSVHWNVDAPIVPGGSDLPVPSEPSPQFGFPGGTYGLYQDFGTGTPVVLHGEERVMTKHEAAGPSITVHNTISAFDTTGIDRVLIRMANMLRDNDAGGRPISHYTNMRDALGIR